MVVAQEMQKPMHGEMGEMVLERLALGVRLARDGLVGDHDVAEYGERGLRLARGRWQPGTTARWSPHPCRANRG